MGLIGVFRESNCLTWTQILQNAQSKFPISTTTKEISYHKYIYNIILGLNLSRLLDSFYTQNLCISLYLKYTFTFLCKNPSLNDIKLWIVVTKSRIYDTPLVYLPWPVRKPHLYTGCISLVASLLVPACNHPPYRTCRSEASPYLQGRWDKGSSIKFGSFFGRSSTT